MIISVGYLVPGLQTMQSCCLTDRSQFQAHQRIDAGKGLELSSFIGHSLVFFVHAMSRWIL